MAALAMRAGVSTGGVPMPRLRSLSRLPCTGTSTVTNSARYPARLARSMNDSVRARAPVVSSAQG